MADITDAERKLLLQFREVIKDIVKDTHDDHYLVRWLRARSHSLEAAEVMYRKSMAWREQVGADTILQTFNCPEVLKKYYTGSPCGFDKEGHPVVINPIGQLDMRGVIYSVRREDIMRRTIYDCEIMETLMQKQSQKVGRRITQTVQVLDFDGFGRSHLWKPGADLFIEILHLVEDNYPEMLRKTYIINAPRIFGICWSFVSQFVAEETKKKFIFLKSDWQKTLRAEFDPSDWPVHWGGDATGPGKDPNCKDRVCMGGKVPEKCYMSKENFFPADASLEKTPIDASTAFIRKYKVEGNGNKALRYFFCTDSGELEFSVLRKPAGREAEELYLADLEVVEPPTVYACHTVPQDGLCVCDRPGVYVLVFSNTKGWGSMLFSRQLTYSVQIIDQEGVTNIPTATTEAALQEQEAKTDGSNIEQAEATKL